MKSLVARARRVAVRSVPVLIEGESGTGKELLARAIHHASPRRDGPLVVVNCGAIPSELVESELFGHKKGAFTGAAKDRAGHFETANGGTLFLNEVGELPLTLQVKLLRVLEEHHVVRVGTSKPIAIDVRVIAATNRDLLQGDRCPALPRGSLLPPRGGHAPAPTAERTAGRREPPRRPAPRPGEPGEPSRAQLRAQELECGR